MTCLPCRGENTSAWDEGQTAGIPVLSNAPVWSVLEMRTDLHPLGGRPVASKLLAGKQPNMTRVDQVFSRVVLGKMMLEKLISRTSFLFAGGTVRVHPAAGSLVFG